MAGRVGHRTEIQYPPGMIRSGVITAMYASRTGL
jgi:hypothetical protein